MNNNVILIIFQHCKFLYKKFGLIKYQISHGVVRLNKTKIIHFSCALDILSMAVIRHLSKFLKYKGDVNQFYCHTFSIGLIRKPVTFYFKICC